MPSLLKNHPIAVEAFFESSLVVAYAFPVEQIRPLVPACLELDVFKERLAFVAVAMVQTQGLRPKGVPKFFGADFFLVGYRVFVRFTDLAGRRSRGLCILGSATDSRWMGFIGNIFTHYNYTTIDLQKIESKGSTLIRSIHGGFSLDYEVPGGEEIALPEDSPFSDWKEARRFAGPLPFTFTYEQSKNRVLVVEGVRENWKPSPVKIIDHHFSFLEDLGLRGGVLSNAFIVRDVPYFWKKGRFEQVPD